MMASLRHHQDAHRGFQLVENRVLTPRELGRLATKLARTGERAEALRLVEEIARGFYGNRPKPRRAAKRVRRR